VRCPDSFLIDPPCQRRSKRLDTAGHRIGSGERCRLQGETAFIEDPFDPAAARDPTSGHINALNVQSASNWGSAKAAL